MFDGLPMPHLCDYQANWLERPLEEEVKVVVRQLEANKAPGPYGFLIAFYRIF